MIEGSEYNVELAKNWKDWMNYDLRFERLLTIDRLLGLALSNALLASS